MTQPNGLNMPEACLSIAIARGHDVCKAIYGRAVAGTAFFKKRVANS